MKYNWQNFEDGYHFEVSLDHGNSSGITRVHIKTYESELNKVAKILQYLQLGVEKNVEKCTEDVAEFIAKKTGFDEDEIFSIIEPAVRSDIKFESFMARIEEVKLFHHEKGAVKWCFIESLSK